MEKFRIKGPTKLTGDVIISGSKNSALPILFASLLTNETIEIKNVPNIKDIDYTIKILKKIGVKIKRKKSIYINSKKINTNFVSNNLIKKIRASILILGPLVLRFGKAKIFFPGGCSIGKRPIDLHIFGLEKFGLIIKIENNYIHAHINNNLRGSYIKMNKISVGATLTIMMTATLSIGTTIIENAACEPEIVDTANFLISIGAKIYGAGSKKIIIKGVTSLKGGIYKILPDRIETATFLIAAAISQGKIICHLTRPDILTIVLNKLSEAGAEIRYGWNWISLDMHGKRPKSVNFSTKPYPGFPTDVQSQFSILNIIANGTSIMYENIFEDRFKHIPELIKMGANVKINQQSILCKGVKQLFGNKVVSTDLRASVSLVLAGCIANGTTIIEQIHHIDRGYENFEKKIRKIGANIKRIF